MIRAPGQRVAATAAVIAACSAAGRAAAPTVDYLFPPGGQQGATVSVTAGGKLDAKSPVQVWTDHPSLKAQPAAAGGTFTLEIAKDAPPGPHLLRVYNAEGASALRVFIVGAEKELAEAEPNDTIEKAQRLDTLPAVINGRLEKSGDVDSYGVKLEAGQWLTCSVLGRRLGAPMDPMLHLYDAANNELAFAHDGLGLDPVLCFRAEKPGTYVVRVSAFPYPPAADIKLSGGPADVYRLSVSTGPAARYAMPAGVRRGAKAQVQVFSWDPAAGPTTREVDATAAAPEVDSLPAGPAGLDAAPRVALGDGPELTEPEAKSASAGQPPAPPFAITGRLERDGEEDAFRFAAKKGEQLVLTARCAGLAAPLDAVLRVEDESGKVLASDDDGGGSNGGDARLQWEAGADGTYRAVVSDLNRQGGNEFVYRLAVTKPAPAVAAAVDGEEYRVAPGKSATIKVTVSRTNGHKGGYVAVATGLPAGVTSTSAEAPENSGDVVLTLTAAADAKPAAGPFRVLLLATDRDHPAALPVRHVLRKDNGQELVEKTDALWLTVLATEEAAAPAKK